jgi:hypothetical protein
VFASPQRDSAVTDCGVLFQSYSRSLVQNGLISQDTAHLIFSNLDKLLDFQRRFQISLETEAEKGSGVNWRMGDWGRAFVKHVRPNCGYLEFLDATDLERSLASSLSCRSESLRCMSRSARTTFKLWSSRPRRR